MKLYQVIIEDYETLPLPFLALILESVFHKNSNEIDYFLTTIGQDGFIVVDELPFQFAEQKVAETRFLAQNDRVHMHCYLEEIEV